MQQSTLLLTAYLIALPVLHALHIAEHHYHYLQLDSDQPVISETVPDCDLCYIYQNQKLVDSNVEDIFLATAFSPFLEYDLSLIDTKSRSYFNLRAPPFYAV